MNAAVLYAVISGCWFIMGYFASRVRHHRFMRRGWEHLRDVTGREKRPFTMSDVFDAFGDDSQW